MKHRIRAAGIAVKDNCVLMLRVQDPYSGEYWIPPGGGFEEGDVSTKQGLKREFKEETNLDVEVGELICVREFYETSAERYHVELFYHITDWTGDANLQNLQGLNDEEYIQEVVWLPIEKLSEYKTFPANLCEEVLPIIEKGHYAKHLGSYVQGEGESINRLDGNE